MGLLKRVANKNGDSFVVKTDEGSFRMSYDEKFNLVFSCRGDIDNKSFIINSSDEAYPFFDSLYDSIINCAPYINFPKDFPNRDKVFPNDLLVFDDKIIYNSDDSNGCFLNIVKNDGYTISFDGEKTLDDRVKVVVNFADSKYLPYNFTFINMYERMKNYWSNRGYTFSKGKSRVRK